MNQREIEARLGVVEALVLSAMRKLSPPQRHELLTGLAFQFGNEPGETLIVEQWKMILDPQHPRRDDLLKWRPSFSVHDGQASWRPRVGARG